MNSDLLKKEGVREYMVSGRTLINSDEISDTDSSSSIFCIFPSDLGLHESAVGVALDSHVAERKSVRGHGGRKSVVYSSLLAALARNDKEFEEVSFYVDVYT